MNGSETEKRALYGTEKRALYGSEMVILSVKIMQGKANRRRYIKLKWK